jgi:hypothetical protein
MGRASAISKLRWVLAAAVLAGTIGSASAGEPWLRRSFSYPAEYVDCGPCGCVSYVRHRELRSTYGLRFDQRNFDQTEPYHYYGRMRTYARYWPAC